MQNDFSQIFLVLGDLQQYFVVSVVVACLVLGYIIKHTSVFKRIPNSDIPAILTVVGAVLNLFVSGFSLNNAIFGALMGLASTGMHQAFKQYIEGEEE